MGLVLSLLYTRHIFPYISDVLALHTIRAATFQCLDGPPQSWDDEPAIFSILLGESEHMS